MNEKLQSELALWLSELRHLAAEGKGLAIEKAPEFVREMVAVGRAETTLIMLFWLGVVVVALVLNRACWRYLGCNYAEERAQMEAGRALACCIAAIVCVVAVLFIGAYLHDFCSSWVAPQVYVADQVAAMARKAAGK